MKIQALTMILLTALSLVGCKDNDSFFESKDTTYGVNNSQWANMNKSERYAAKEAFREQQYLAGQRRLNAELVRARNERLAQE